MDLIRILLGILILVAVMVMAVVLFQIVFHLLVSTFVVISVLWPVLFIVFIISANCLSSIKSAFLICGAISLVLGAILGIFTYLDKDNNSDLSWGGWPTQEKSCGCKCQSSGNYWDDMFRGC